MSTVSDRCVTARSASTRSAILYRLGPTARVRAHLRHPGEHGVLGEPVGDRVELRILNVDPVACLPLPELASPVAEDRTAVPVGEAFGDEAVGDLHGIRWRLQLAHVIRVCWFGADRDHGPRARPLNSGVVSRRALAAAEKSPPCLRVA